MVFNIFKFYHPSSPQKKKNNNNNNKKLVNFCVCVK